ncbi:dynein intermediate chain 2, ciliary [Ctenocephalides felis]|uniref:dynein intermediate chain 2, ciliary n=1 Tax=Ctenocephalides felis TaxID=7515 RepID=UPI000E6E3799|nr:dynein intermediate chain 2, ciliary [Ctenocephalides felis]
MAEPRKSQGAADDMAEWLKSRQLQKPDDQLELPDAELNEEVPRLISCDNPNKPDNLVEYSYAERTFVPVPPIGNTVVLLEFPGTCLHRESEEAITQLIDSGLTLEEIEEMLNEWRRKLPEEDVAETVEDEEQGKEAWEEEHVSEEDQEEDEGGEGDTEKEEAAAEVGPKAGEGDEEPTEPPPQPAPMPRPGAKLKNQFNFCERAALTYNNPSRSVETQTIPPPRSQFGDILYQWTIYDDMEADFEAQQREKEKEKKVIHRHDEVEVRVEALNPAEVLTRRIFEGWKVLERMINQNTFDHISQDYRYWEDPADDFREEEGTLLPLWKFTHHKIGRHTITDLCFNPMYYDLFAVTFGSVDFLKQPEEGALALYTIKNPSYPEYICMTRHGAMCVDIHPTLPYLVVVGFFDGSVSVYNVQLPPPKPQFMSDAVNNKHCGIIWEIKWGPDMQDGEKNFYSCSGDGKVKNWVMMLTELSVTTVITLLRSFDIIPGPDGTTIPLKGSASCLCFHPGIESIFMVGTEEGKIHKCSTAYSASYLQTYNAHTMPVYRIDFNKFNSSIFISCSGDWRIKIWEDVREDPLFVFDLNSPVGDVKWAPYSSTVFGACTQEGKLYIFDLNVNKYKPICVQPVVSRRRSKLTRMAFNPKLPFIICGDDKGNTSTLKLSPNLRKMCKAPKKQQGLDQRTMQIAKLDKLLSLVREPNVLPQKDITITEDS